jgi:hypothetical protein
MLTLIDRGADFLSRSGSLTEEAADALRKEARRRAEAGEFFGHISFCQRDRAQTEPRGATVSLGSR